MGYRDQVVDLPSPAVQAEEEPRPVEAPAVGNAAGPRVVLVHYEDYPWDIRIEKFLHTLAECCAEVHLVARNRGKRAIEEQHGNVWFHRLYPLAVDGFTASLLDSPMFCNPRWFRRIGEVVTRVRPQVVMVRDLPLALGCRYWARKTGAQFLFDMAEDYPGMFAAYHPWETFRERAINLVLRNSAIARIVEWASLGDVDGLLVVTEEQGARVRRMGVPAEKITVVSNTPVQPCNPEHRPTSELTLIYVGEVHHMRGLDCAIRAVGRVARAGGKIRFRIIGRGKTEEELKRLAAREAPEQVVFEGWMDFARVPEALAGSDVGIVPHVRNAFTDTTVPNKIFDYMAAALPVVASDCAPMKRVIEESGCGFAFHSGDDAELAAILKRLQDPRLRRELGRNGMAAVQQRYHWAHDARRLRETVLAAASRSRAC